MKLYELFQTAYDYKRIGNDYYFTTPNNKTYRVNYYNVEFYYQWHLIKTVHLGFGLIKDDHDNPSDDIENTGDAFAVFSTVGHILKEVVQSNGLNNFLLAANRSHPSRVKLYGSFVKHLAKFLPGWKMQFMTDNVYPEYRLWMLVKEGTSVFEQTSQLNELFDKPYAFKHVDAEDNYYFKTKNNEQYVVAFVQDTFIDPQNRKAIHGIAVEFGKKVGSDWNTGVTGSGDPFAVFSTIISIIKDYLKTNDPNCLMFTGSLEEEGRIKLYDTFATLVSRLVPGWTLAKKYDSPYERFYVFLKQ